MGVRRVGRAEGVALRALWDALLPKLIQVAAMARPWRMIAEDPPFLVTSRTYYSKDETDITEQEHTSSCKEERFGGNRLILVLLQKCRIY